MKNNRLSVFLCYLLRHNPDEAGLHMDEHGWVDVRELIEGVNRSGKYTLDIGLLREIVAADEKGRYRFSEDGRRIKACQGHSLEWVIPELEYRQPPEYLYHGTTVQAWEKISACGYISRMNRHAVHMQENPEKAWQSARRWRGAAPVLLKIDARTMHNDGFVFGVTENEVWCAEHVPVSYICEVIEE